MCWFLGTAVALPSRRQLPLSRPRTQHLLSAVQVPNRAARDQVHLSRPLAVGCWRLPHSFRVLVRHTERALGRPEEGEEKRKEKQKKRKKEKNIIFLGSSLRNTQSKEGAGIIVRLDPVGSFVRSPGYWYSALYLFALLRFLSSSPPFTPHTSYNITSSGFGLLGCHTIREPSFSFPPTSREHPGKVYHILRPCLS